MDNKMKISFVIPAYNEEGNVSLLAEKIVTEIDELFDYKMIFVNDGNTDNTLQISKLLNKNNPKIHYISLSRNFGHQNALRAGIDYANGDCVISMDADLQHPPSLIRPMIDKWLEGYHIVYTVREEGLVAYSYFCSALLGSSLESYLFKLRADHFI